MKETIKTTYVPFKREMARAYAEGRKRMTRRVMRVQPPDDDYCLSRIVSTTDDRFRIGKLHWIVRDEFRVLLSDERYFRCPFGKPGDQLILGTTWAAWAEYDNWKPSDLPIGSQIWSYFDSNEKPDGFGKLRPGRFLPGFLRDRMPRETLKIVRAERVHDITVEDIIKEGLVSYLREHDACCDLRDKWIKLWNTINADRGFSWESNPWVWALEWLDEIKQRAMWRNRYIHP
jgi:hypothetical protein